MTQAAVIPPVAGASERTRPGRIPWARPDFWGNEQDYVCDALRSTWISGGPYVERLEAEVAEYCGVPYALAVSNGTTAIHLAFLALGIGPGDEVIVPGFCFMAAANMALHVGARPVFAEVDPKTWCLTAEEAEKHISPHTRAIVPVHTYGNVCDMEPILKLARERSIVVVEDTAEAFATTYRGMKAGAIGDIGTYSFQATKTITTGEGGMVVTHDKALFEQMILFRSHGMNRRRYWHEVAGHNFRLTNLQAALGCAQMEKLDSITAQRRRVHRRYKNALGNSRGLILQWFDDDIDPVLWAMAVRLEPESYPQGRDSVIEQLMDAGIETRPGFYAASLMDVYDHPEVPICEGLGREIISLPTFPSLSDEEVVSICKTLEGLRS